MMDEPNSLTWRQFRKHPIQSFPIHLCESIHCMHWEYPQGYISNGKWQDFGVFLLQAQDFYNKHELFYLEKTIWWLLAEHLLYTRSIIIITILYTVPTDILKFWEWNMLEHAYWLRAASPFTPSFSLGFSMRNKQLILIMDTASISVVFPQEDTGVPNQDHKRLTFAQVPWARLELSVAH